MYVEEVPSGSRPIEGVPTSVAGFVGAAAQGPIAAHQVRDWREFREIYGDPVADSHLAGAVRGFFDNGGKRLYVARVLPADRRTGLTVDDYVGDRGLPESERTGLAALETIDEISILAVPDEVRRRPHDLSAVTDAVIAQCERRRDRFAVLSTIAGQRDVHALPPRPDSAWAALYYPWIEVRHPATGKPTPMPATGHVAGVYARTDATRGVHKAPANEPLRGVDDLEFPVSQQMQDVLNPLGVNSLRDFRAQGRGIVVWGARTLTSDPEWKYVPVRRLFIFLEESIDKGTQWVVFEPNDEPLWSRVRQQVEAFLTGLWRDGALQGAKPEEAFFVRCDRSTMTQNDIDNGRLVCLVGVAPLRPAEFVIFRIGQKTAEAR